MRGAYRNRRRDRGGGTSRSQPNLKHWKPIEGFPASRVVTSCQGLLVTD